MTPRRAAIAATASLLYLGPLLAGLIGAPFQALPAFALIFLIWLIVMRPAHSIGANPAWTDPALWLRLLATLLIQLGLVTICSGAGQGLALVLPPPPITLAWPLALSALSVPLSRAVRAPYTAEMDAYLDGALAELEQVADQIAAPVETVGPNTRETLLIDLACTAIEDLPATAGITEIEIVTASITGPQAAATLLQRLRPAAASHSPSALTMSVLAFRPDVTEADPSGKAPHDALIRALETDNPHVIRLTADLAAAALHRNGSKPALPAASVLLSAAAGLAAQDQEAAAHSLRAVVKALTLGADNANRHTDD